MLRRHLHDTCSMAWRWRFPTHWLISTQSRTIVSPHLVALGVPSESVCWFGTAQIWGSSRWVATLLLERQAVNLHCKRSVSKKLRPITVICVASKVQLGLQFWVCRGRREVLLAPVGRLHERGVVSEFELKTSVPRQRDRSHSARSAERRHDDGVEGSATLSDAVDAKISGLTG